MKRLIYRDGYNLVHESVKQDLSLSVENDDDKKEILKMPGRASDPKDQVVIQFKKKKLRPREFIAES